MTASKEFYQLRSRSLDSLVSELNFILARISDRLDKIEGVRGGATIQDSLTITGDDNVIHGFNTEDET